MELQVLALDLQQILADDYLTTKVRTGGVDPHLIGHSRIISGHEVRENQRLDAAALP